MEFTEKLSILQNFFQTVSKIKSSPYELIFVNDSVASHYIMVKLRFFGKICFTESA